MTALVPESPADLAARIIAEARAAIRARGRGAAAPAPPPAPDPLELATDPGQLATLRAAVGELDAQRRRYEADMAAAIAEAAEVGEDPSPRDVAGEAAMLRAAFDLKVRDLAAAEAQLEAALAAKRPTVPDLDTEKRAELRQKASRLGDHRLGELVVRMVQDRDLASLAAIRDMIPARHQGTVGKMLESPVLTTAEQARVETFRGHLRVTAGAVHDLQHRTLSSAAKEAVRAADIGVARGRDLTSEARLAYCRKHGSAALMSLPW